MIYYVFLMVMHALEMHTIEMHALEMLHALEMHALEMLHALEMYTLEMYTLEIGPSSTLHNLKYRMSLAPSRQSPRLSKFCALWESQAVP